MESMCLKLNLIQSEMACGVRSSTMKANGGSVRVNNQLTCRSMNSIKLPCARLWNIFQGYLNIKSNPGFVVRAEAAGGSFPDSCESCETDVGGDKMVIKSEVKLSNGRSNGKEFMASQTEGPDIGDGDGGHRHGGKGNNGGGDSNNNSDGYGSGNKLINTICWLILLYIRMMRISSTMWGNDRPEQVIFEFILVILIMVTGCTEPSTAPSVPIVTQVTMTLFSGLVVFFTQLETCLRAFMCMMLAGFAAVLDWCVI